MKTARTALRIAVVLFASSALLLSGGCRKKESPAPGAEGGGGDMVRLNDLTEIDNYREILRKDPNNLQALGNLGNLYFDNHQDRQAIEAYQRALAIDPRNNNIRTDMAVCYRRIGNPDRALEELGKVISIDPRHAQARYNVGVILMHDKGDTAGAIKAWEALLANVPDYPYRDSLKAEVERMKGLASGQGGTETGGKESGGGPSGLKFGK
jgi:tetratricopeptide (TPR) repeat protein